jgi:hypothetical protein
MRNKMKIQVIILLLFCFSFQDLIGQEMGLTKAEIIKFRVIKIDTRTISGNSISESSTYYDKQGNKSMYIMEASNYKYIAYYEFRDSLLMKLIGVTYNDGVLADSVINKFSYKFDSDGKIIENTLYKPSGEIFITKTIYNDIGKIDTTYQYTTSGNEIVKMTECTKYNYLGDKTFQYNYDSLGWNSPNYKIIECSYSDTLMSFFTKEYKMIEGAIKEYKKYSTRLFLAEGRQKKFESDNGNIVVEHYYEKDQKGLVASHTMHSKSPTSEQTQVDKFEYWFGN